MPPRMGTVNTAGTGASAWYMNLPPITRAYGTAVFLTTLAVSFRVIHPSLLILHWPFVYKLEIWRIFTTFIFVGGFSFPFVVKLLWIINYGSSLERDKYRFEPATFLFLFLFCGLSLLAISCIIPQLHLMMLSDSIIFSLLHIWSRHNPEQNTSIMGLFQIQAFYLPFAFAGLTMVMGGNPIPDIVGIVVGHMFYYLMDLYPHQTGRQIMHTPGFLRTLSANWGLEAPRPTETGATNTFRAFRGSGRRLGTD